MSDRASANPGFPAAPLGTPPSLAAISLSRQVSVAGLSLLLPRRALRREPQPQVPGADGSCPGPSLSADGGSGRGGVLSSSGRSGSLWGSWGKAPQGKLPMALRPWPLWDPDKQQPETGSAGAEVEIEMELQAEAEGERDEPPE